MQKALELLRTCDCLSDSGCPACIQNPDCGEYNAVLSKRAAIVVLCATIQAESEHRARMALQVSHASIEAEARGLMNLPRGCDDSRV